MKKYTEKELIEIGKEKEREYQRNWRKENKDKVKEYNQRYWKKKALEHIQEEKEA